MQQRFGGSHTQRKLESLEKYLSAYTTALKNQSFTLVYFDAFAGTGEIEHADPVGLPFPVELEATTRGSARRALELDLPFDQYIFVESQREKFELLKGVEAEFAQLAGRVRLIQGDANAELVRFCGEENWRFTRAVVFLDPFGNEVGWQTIETIASTKGIDLWYLFPAGLGVARQIGRDGRVHWTHAKSLDRLFGTAEWREAALRERETSDLFGPRLKTEKTATAQSMTEFMIERMRTVFEGGVLDEWLPLGSNNRHMYSLIFAWANPSPRTKRLATILAKAVLS